jgi:hypothetical protein
MKNLRHLSWENFRTSICVRNEQRVHRVSVMPLVEIFSDGIQNRIGVWLQISDNSIVPEEVLKLAFISAQIIKRKKQTILEISNSRPALQRQFYYFAIAVAERMVVDGKTAIEAVKLELQCFEDLLSEIPLLSIERQIGLLGELIFLERLTGKLGHKALDAGIGPSGEPHDFRIQKHEFEVKTTFKPYRIHAIHGSEQLVPSDGCTLHLVSVLLGPPGAGDGFSLTEKIKAVAALFQSSTVCRDRFAENLEAAGFRDADDRHYIRRFIIRRPIAVALVDKLFPALTRPVIHKVLGARSSRIESVQYDVNIEGLESEEGTRGFSSVLPF